MGHQRSTSIANCDEVKFGCSGTLELLTNLRRSEAFYAVFDAEQTRFERAIRLIFCTPSIPQTTATAHSLIAAGNLSELLGGLNQIASNSPDSAW